MNKKLYILHGWAYSIDKWDPLFARLKASRIEAVMLKIPGLTAPLDEVWDLDNYVTWLAKTLENEKNVILVGHSNGGRISLAFAAKYPEKVEKIILIDSAGIYHNEFPIRIKRFVFGRIAKIGKTIIKSSSARAILYKLSREHDYEKANPIVRQTMLHLIRADLREMLPSITIPTTIIWGEMDKVTPLSDGKLMNQLLPKSSLHVIPEARHSPQFTHGEKVADIIQKSV